MYPNIPAGVNFMIRHYFLSQNGFQLFFAFLMLFEALFSWAVQVRALTEPKERKKVKKHIFLSFGWVGNVPAIPEMIILPIYFSDKLRTSRMNFFSIWNFGQILEAHLKAFFMFLTRF